MLERKERPVGRRIERVKKKASKKEDIYIYMYMYIHM